MLSKHDVWANFKQCFVSPVEIQRLGQLANSVKIGGIFMKRVLILLMVAATSNAAAEATHRQCRVVADPSCCQPRTDHCSTSGGGSNRWYKAKDGTFREMMNYRDALSRAEDADDMEIQLRGIQEELVSAKAGIETMQSETAKLKADLEGQIASLQQQLETERQTVVAQKERGDKAEAAHKQCIEQIASLRDAGRKSDETLKATQSELSRTTEERDNLKAARADLELKLSEMTAAKVSAEDAARVSQQELEKLKHDAAESKKSAVETDDKADESPEPGGEKSATDGGTSSGFEVSNN